MKVVFILVALFISSLYAMTPVESWFPLTVYSVLILLALLLGNAMRKRHEENVKARQARKQKTTE